MPPQPARAISRFAALRHCRRVAARPQCETHRDGCCCASARGCASFVAVAEASVSMLFGRRKQLVKRILVVEDEPLTAFENENVLGDAGYEIVATVDDLEEALAVLEREDVDLILSDVRLRDDQTGIHLARAARERGVPTLFATATQTRRRARSLWVA